MGGIAMALAMLGVAASALLQILTDPRITRRFINRTLLVLAAYAAHAAVIVFVLVFLWPTGPDAAAGAVIACLGWLGLGFLGLVRLAPRLREPPKLLMQVGPADAVCLLAIAGGVLLASGVLG